MGLQSRLFWAVSLLGLGACKDRSQQTAEVREMAPQSVTAPPPDPTERANVLDVPPPPPAPTQEAAPPDANVEPAPPPKSE
ncbi:MAG: hypothetical protein JST16_09740 [Bdellovibrionales bacterium]|nr:hypothetical protein [Bdellovibrionales bacterium]